MFYLESTHSDSRGEKIAPYLFQIVKNAAALAAADGGIIRFTDRDREETFEAAYHPPATESQSEGTRVWSPKIPFGNAHLTGSLRLYRQAPGGADRLSASRRDACSTDFPDTLRATFSPAECRRVDYLLETAAWGLEETLKAIHYAEHLHAAGLGTVEAMTEAFRHRDPYTFDHGRRVADYAVQLAEGLGWREVENLWWTGVAHDVGKMGVLDGILLKPGRLGREEMDFMRRHPHWGGEIVKQFRNGRSLEPGVRYHHEWLNGRGYPDGLQGAQIPPEARLMAVADAYDAMTTDRPYRNALTPSEALNRLAAGRGIQFDPEIVAVAQERFKRN